MPALIEFGTLHTLSWYYLIRRSCIDLVGLPGWRLGETALTNERTPAASSAPAVASASATGSVRCATFHFESPLLPAEDSPPLVHDA
jgi:hypothetical protein